MAGKKETLFIILILALYCTTLYAWGFWGHKKINRMAVFILPTDMIGFFKQNIVFLSEHAVDADKRRYAIPDEAPRHYIDLDHYGNNPFDTLPVNWNDAVNKFSEDTLMAYGIVPWYAIKIFNNLTSAMQKGETERVLKYAADLGHYVADAHVPLHCTQNYNGQLTGQTGIHGFWESRLPELFGNDYDFIVGRAQYIKNPQQFMWQVVRESFNAKDSVLLLEAKLNSETDADKKYSYEQRGSTNQKVYSEHYSAAYNKMLAGMVERRMRQAIWAVGSLWYTAWVNAGMPDLKALSEYAMSEEYKKQLEQEDKMWRTGKPVNNKGHDD